MFTCIIPCSLYYMFTCISYVHQYIICSPVYYMFTGILYVHLYIICSGVNHMFTCILYVHLYIICSPVYYMFTCILYVHLYIIYVHLYIICSASAVAGARVLLSCMRSIPTNKPQPLEIKHIQYYIDRRVTKRISSFSKESIFVNKIWKTSQTIS